MNRLSYGFFIWFIIFIAAVVLLIYSFFEIWQTQRSIDHALQDWDEQHLSLLKLKGFANEDSIPNQKSSTRQNNELWPIDQLDSLPPNPITEKGKIIGKITFDPLNRSYPIIEGTDASELSQGVGHYSASVLPGEKGNSVLAGHRDSVFRKLGSLKPNDQISIETISVNFNYVVTGSKIVEADDTSVFLGSEASTLTLITCYPFHYVGNAPKRYLLFAKLN